MEFENCKLENIYSIMSESALFIKVKTVEDMSAFTSALHDISEECIPKSSTSSIRRNPWFNKECKIAINKHKSALRKCNFEKIFCIPNKHVFVVV